ncbi:MAG: flippase [Patescibacteria group bacterium]
MSLVSQIAKNTSYQVFGKVVGAAIGLVVVGMMTRYLGQEGFGNYTTVVAFLQFFGVLADFGLQMTVTKMISRPGADEKKIIANAFTLRFFSAAAVLGLAVAVGWFFPYVNVIKRGLVIASASFFFISLQSVLISFFQKRMDSKKIALAEIVGRLMLLVGVYLAIVYQEGLLYILLAVALGSLANFFILFISAESHIAFRFDFDFKIWRQIWSATWPLALTIALTLVYFRADTLIMSIFRPQSEVGLYGAAYKVVEVLVQFPYLFLGFVLPLLANFFIADKKMFSAILQKSFDFLFILAAPMVLGTLVVGEKIMAFIAGQDFIVSGDILKILILAVATIYLGALFGYAVVAGDLQKKMIRFYVFDALISLVLYLIFIPLYSYWAAATITVLSELIMAFSAFYVLKKYTGVGVKFNLATKATISAALMAAAIYLISLVQSHNVFTLILVGIIIYFGALYLMRGINKEMMREIVGYKS